MQQLLSLGSQRNKASKRRATNELAVDVDRHSGRFCVDIDQKVPVWPFMDLASVVSPRRPRLSTPVGEATRHEDDDHCKALGGSGEYWHIDIVLDRSGIWYS